MLIKPERRYGGQQYLGEVARERGGLRAGLPQGLQGRREGGAGPWRALAHRPGEALT